jgi:hypothetical protein
VRRTAEATLPAIEAASPALGPAPLAAWCETGLQAAALLFIPLLVLLPRGAAALTSVSGLCALGLVLSTRGKRFSPRFALAATLLGLVLLWGAMSAFWSITPLRSAVVAGRLTGLFAAGLALIRAADCLATPRRLILLLMLGLTLGLARAWV